MIRRMLAAIVAVAIFAAPALAARWHVRPGFSGNGTTYTNAWGSLNSAAGVAAGDTVLVYGSNVPGQINPSTSPTGGNRFYYMAGYAIPVNPTNGPEGGVAYITSDSTQRMTPTWPSIGEQTIRDSYVVVKNLRVNGDLLSATGAARDSIVQCTFTGSLRWSRGDYSVIQQCQFLGIAVRIGQTSDVYARLAGFSVLNSQFMRLGVGSVEPGQQNHLFMVGSGHDDAICSAPGRNRGYVDSLQFKFNRIFMKLEVGNNDRHGISFLQTHRMNWYGNYTELSQQTPVTVTMVRMRDSSSFNRFRASTFVGYGETVDFMLSASSASERCSLGVVQGQMRAGKATSIDSCYINLYGAVDSKVFWQIGMLDFSMSYTTVVTQGPSILPTGEVRGRNWLRRNTFIAKPRFDAVVDLSNANSLPESALVIKNNIMYVAGSTGAGVECKNYGGGYQYPRAGAIFYPHHMWTFPADSFLPRRVFADSNVYASYEYNEDPGDKVILLRYEMGGYIGCMGIADYRAFSKQDSNSVYGSPLLGWGGPDSSNFAAIEAITKPDTTSAAWVVPRRPDGGGSYPETYAGAVNPFLLPNPGSFDFFPTSHEFIVGIPDTITIYAVPRRDYGGNGYLGHIGDYPEVFSNVVVKRVPNTEADWTVPAYGLSFEFTDAGTSFTGEAAINFATGPVSIGKVIYNGVGSPGTAFVKVIHNDPAHPSVDPYTGDPEPRHVPPPPNAPQIPLGGPYELPFEPPTYTWYASYLSITVSL
ncbi:MAG: hypothetical protein ACKVW3_01905 [Phycisphaerales bacterium]